MKDQVQSIDINWINTIDRFFKRPNDVRYIFIETTIGLLTKQKTIIVQEKKGI